MYPSLHENQAWAQRASDHASRPASEDMAPAIAGNGYYAPQNGYRQQPTSSLRTRRPMSNQYTGGYINAVYWSGDSVLAGHRPSSLNPLYITHLFYSYATVNYDGTVIFANPRADTDMEVDGCKGGLLACRALKSQNPSMKLILCIGGAASALAFPFLISPDHKQFIMKRFLLEIQQLVQRFGLDGVEICWEHPVLPKDAEEGCSLVSVLAATRAALPPNKGNILTASLSGSLPILEKIDIEQLQHFVEYVTLKSYGMASPESDKTAHSAQLLSPTLANTCSVPSCQAAVNYLHSQKFPLDKVILGVSCTGQAFGGASAVDQPFTELRSIPYRDLPLPGSEETVDEMCVAAYCTDGRTWVSYDCPETVQNKARFVKMRRMRGLCFWNVHEDQRGSQSLVFAGHDALKSVNT